MIKSDPAVLDAKIILDNGVPIFGSEYFIEILFNDGNIIEVKDVNDYGKVKRMKILYVNGYVVSIVNAHTFRSVDSEQRLKLFSVFIGVELKTIMDIVRNYLVICSKVGNMVNVSDYRQDNERIYITGERLLAKNLLPLITFDGQEYCLYKWK
jgi:hypothetical protein